MSAILTCPQGDAVTCAILEVANALSDGPSQFTVWATLVVPLLAAMASTAVAVVSASIAKRARDIAEASEDARVVAEGRRVEREQQQRLDGAIRDVFVAIAVMIRDLEKYESDVKHWSLNWSKGARLEPAPADSGLLANIAAARLEATTGDERQMLDELSRVVITMRGHTTAGRRAWLEELWGLVVDWRHASSSERPAALRKFMEVEPRDTKVDVEENEPVQ